MILIFVIVSFSMLLSGLFIISDFFHTKEEGKGTIFTITFDM
ncbi:hypothetical protein TGS27_2621 [Geobacillus stearothermophilus]|uniref:Uncharacterized protein n=1 Tax=Geobacillus stearothermophilus TaxID=1422 RepID=A0A150MJM1_GEOSE|nr:hypothetical protein GS8_1836 [Geobacillus stearothermophilus]KYD24727.1 hypothetical protein B4109_0493 [Geobacillus stearothermophilus]MED4978588.1 hypothetical protein [Geobacillus stearothermophilus]OAO77795.1 hypothetical protein TGS27_2621 [Geobacillus stearothermophilus]